MQETLTSSAFQTVLEDLGLDPNELLIVSSTTSGEVVGARNLLLEVTALEPPPELAQEVREWIDRGLLEDGTLLLFVEGRASERDLAAWRNALWPLCHCGLIYRMRSGSLWRRTLSSDETLPGSIPACGTLLIARRRAQAMSPDVTVEKFDTNAAGWNGDPGGPGYPHFRWMRRYVAHFAAVPDAARILDFGCGAGWVGIEAALRAPGCVLHGFDPSPEMVRIAQANALHEGLREASFRPGFGEDPPFPGPGEEAYDLVLSSGVVSFAPDPERWLEGLEHSLKPAATLVIGDIHRDSRGMRGRRARKALLPVRELNALARRSMRAMLEQRGFVHEESAAYQLTFPIPQAMFVNETRLKGLLTWPLLWTNQAMTAVDRALGSPASNQFDSWVMRFRAPN